MNERCADNVIVGTVCLLREHGLHAIVTVDVCGSYLRADVPMGPVRHARLSEGSRAAVAFDPCDAMIARSKHPLEISSASQLKGRISRIETDEVEACVLVGLDDGQDVRCVLTTESLDEVGATVGDDVWVLVRSCDVMPL